MRQPHGQNFLTDKNIAVKIIDSAFISKDDFVVEIGPGKGILTDILKNLTDNLTAVDIDKNLAGALALRYKDLPGVKIVNADFLKFELPDRPFKVVANLPYNVGTPIFRKILQNPYFVSAVLMLQKDVITRLLSGPGSKDYGYISIFREYYASSEFLFDVPPGCFSPKPKVMSAVAGFYNKTPEAPGASLFPFVKHCFTMRRKTILNGLSTYLRADKIAAREILQNAGIDCMTRPDKLDLKDYIKLAALL